MVGFISLMVVKINPFENNELQCYCYRSSFISFIAMAAQASASARAWW